MKRFFSNQIEYYTLLCFIFYFFVTSSTLCLAFPNSSSKIKKNLGAIASQHPLATESAAKILKQGGNAVDAAVAAALTLSVVEPYNSGLGSGGFAMFWDGKKAFAIDFREKAPQQAHENMFSGKKMASRQGPLAIAVPGELAGLAHLHAKWGSLPWENLFKDAIHYAKEGFAPSTHFKKRIQKKSACLMRDFHSWKVYHPFFPKSFTENSASRLSLTSKKVTKSKKSEESGPEKVLATRLIQKDLAVSLEKISQQGVNIFYQGDIAQEMVHSIQSKGGILSLEDLKSYQVIERPALKEKYSWGQLWTMPLPSSGGISVIRALNSMEAISKRWSNLKRKGDLKKESFEKNWPLLMVSVLKKVFQTRNQKMGDSEFIPKLPISRWTSKGFAHKEAQSILASYIKQSKQIQNSLPQQLQKNTSLKSEPHTTKKSFLKTQGETTHLSILDSQGKAVSMTLTQNLSFGSCVTAGQSGILMNSQMDDFSTQLNQANAFGLTQSSANKVEAHKRPLSSMTPLIVTQKKQAILVAGSPGGPRIITTVAQILFRYFHLKENLFHAISATRFHYQGQPHKVFIEKENRNLKDASLLFPNYETELQKPWSNFQAVSFDPKTKHYQAFSDPRAIGKALLPILELLK